jgi:hypothetical protein
MSGDCSHGPTADKAKLGTRKAPMRPGAAGRFYFLLLIIVVILISLAQIRTAGRTEAIKRKSKIMMKTETTPLF